MKIRQKKKDPSRTWSSKGFTFVELLVVLAISGLVTVGMVNFMVSQSRSYSGQEEIQERDQNARAALEILTEELRKATRVVPDAMNRGSDDNISIAYIGEDGNQVENIYNLVSGTAGTENDAISRRIAVKNGPLDFGYVDDDNIGSIAFFITQDLDGDGSVDTPLFRYDDRNDPHLVTVTIIARTRHEDPYYQNPDPNYDPTNHYRQTILSQQVVLRSRL